MLSITRDTAEFLSVLVRATLARRVLEIGTAFGYSTLWLAEAAKDIDGTVTTVESSGSKVRQASENFARSGLSSYIKLVHDDAGRVLKRSAPDAFDLVFLDSEPAEYPNWWIQLRRVVRPGGLLVADKASSQPEQMAPFIALVEADSAFTRSLIPVGNGEFLAVKAHRPFAAKGARIEPPAPREETPLFHSIMTDEEISQAAEKRRREAYDPYRRKEKPDPWPLIEDSFPRVAACIRQLWGDPALDQYLAKLVVDDRGGREGFPPDVLTAILQIAWLHSERFRFSRSTCPWEADARETKWWNRD